MQATANATMPGCGSGSWSSSQNGRDELLIEAHGLLIAGKMVHVRVYHVMAGTPASTPPTSALASQRLTTLDVDTATSASSTVSQSLGFRVLAIDELDNEFSLFVTRLKAEYLCRPQTPSQSTASEITTVAPTPTLEIMANSIIDHIDIVGNRNRDVGKLICREPEVHVIKRTRAIPERDAASKQKNPHLMAKNDQRAARAKKTALRAQEAIATAHRQGNLAALEQQEMGLRSKRSRKSSDDSLLHRMAFSNDKSVWRSGLETNYEERTESSATSEASNGTSTGGAPSSSQSDASTVVASAPRRTIPDRKHKHKGLYERREKERKQRLLITRAKSSSSIIEPESLISLSPSVAALAVLERPDEEEQSSQPQPSSGNIRARFNAAVRTAYAVRTLLGVKSPPEDEQFLRRRTIDTTEHRVLKGDNCAFPGMGIEITNDRPPSRGGVDEEDPYLQEKLRILAQAARRSSLVRDKDGNLIRRSNSGRNGSFRRSTCTPLATSASAPALGTAVINSDIFISKNEVQEDDIVRQMSMREHEVEQSSESAPVFAAIASGVDETLYVEDEVADPQPALEISASTLPESTFSDESAHDGTCEDTNAVDRFSSTADPELVLESGSGARRSDLEPTLECQSNEVDTFLSIATETRGVDSTVALPIQTNVCMAASLDSASPATPRRSSMASPITSHRSQTCWDETTPVEGRTLTARNDPEQTEAQIQASHTDAACTSDEQLSQQFRSRPKSAGDMISTKFDPERDEDTSVIVSNTTETNIPIADDAERGVDSPISVHYPTEQLPIEFSAPGSVAVEQSLIVDSEVKELNSYANSHDQDAEPGPSTIVHRNTVDIHDGSEWRALSDTHDQYYSSESSSGAHENIVTKDDNYVQSSLSNSQDQGNEMESSVAIHLGVATDDHVNEHTFRSSSRERDNDVETSTILHASDFTADGINGLGLCSNSHNQDNNKLESSVIAHPNTSANDDNEQISYSNSHGQDNKPGPSAIPHPSTPAISFDIKVNSCSSSHDQGSEAENSATAYPNVTTVDDVNEQSPCSNSEDPGNKAEDTAVADHNTAAVSNGTELNSIGKDSISESSVTAQDVAGDDGKLCPFPNTLDHDNKSETLMTSNHDSVTIDDANEQTSDLSPCDQDSETGSLAIFHHSTATISDSHELVLSTSSHDQNTKLDSPAITHNSEHSVTDSNVDSQSAPLTAKQDTMIAMIDQNAASGDVVVVNTTRRIQNDHFQHQAVHRVSEDSLLDGANDSSIPFKEEIKQVDCEDTKHGNITVRNDAMSDAQKPPVATLGCADIAASPTALNSKRSDSPSGNCSPSMDAASTNSRAKVPNKMRMINRSSSQRTLPRDPRNSPTKQRANPSRQQPGHPLPEAKLISRRKSAMKGASPAANESSDHDSLSLSSANSNTNNGNGNATGSHDDTSSSNDRKQTKTKRQHSVVKGLSSAVSSYHKTWSKWINERGIVEKISCLHLEEQILAGQQTEVALVKLGVRYAQCSESSLAAILLFEHAAAMHENAPRTHEFWYNLGNAYLSLFLRNRKFLPVARFHLARCVKSLTRAFAFMESMVDPQVLLRFALCTFWHPDEGHLDRADDIFRELFARFPSFCDRDRLNLLFLHFQVLHRLKMFAEACECINKVIALASLTVGLATPDDKTDSQQRSVSSVDGAPAFPSMYELADYWMMKMQCQQACGDYVQATDTFSRVVSAKGFVQDGALMDEQYLELWLDVAEKCFHHEDYALAAEYYPVALNFAKESHLLAALRYKLGLCFQALGDSQRCVTEYKRARNMNRHVRPPISLAELRGTYDDQFAMLLEKPVRHVIEEVRVNLYDHAVRQLQRIFRHKHQPPPSGVSAAGGTSEGKMPSIVTRKFSLPLSRPRPISGSQQLSPVSPAGSGAVADTSISDMNGSIEMTEETEADVAARRQAEFEARKQRALDQMQRLRSASSNDIHLPGLPPKSTRAVRVTTKSELLSPEKERPEVRRLRSMAAFNQVGRYVEALKATGTNTLALMAMQLGYLPSSTPCVDHWEKMLSLATDLFPTRRSVTRSTSAIRSMLPSVSDEVAFCALADALGDVDNAIERLRDASYERELSFMCSVIDVERKLEQALPVRLPSISRIVELPAARSPANDAARLSKPVLASPLSPSLHIARSRTSSPLASPRPIRLDQMLEVQFQQHLQAKAQSIMKSAASVAQEAGNVQHRHEEFVVLRDFRQVNAALIATPSPTCLK